MEELDWDAEVQKEIDSQAKAYHDARFLRELDKELKEYYHPRLNGDAIHDYNVMKGRV
jgi:hypothetical protein